MTFAADGMFSYENKNKMLLFGTLVYALCFISSYPFFMRINEKVKDNKNIGFVALTAFASCAITFICFDIVSQIIGHI